MTRFKIAKNYSSSSYKRKEIRHRNNLSKNIDYYMYKKGKNVLEEIVWFRGYEFLG